MLRGLRRDSCEGFAFRVSCCKLISFAELGINVTSPRDNKVTALMSALQRMVQLTSTGCLLKTAIQVMLVCYVRQIASTPIEPLGRLQVVRMQACSQQSRAWWPLAQGSCLTRHHSAIFSLYRQNAAAPIRAPCEPQAERMHLLLYSKQNLTVTGQSTCSMRQPGALFKQHGQPTIAPIWASQERSSSVHACAALRLRAEIDAHC